MRYLILLLLLFVLSCKSDNEKDENSVQWQEETPKIQSNDTNLFCKFELEKLVFSLEKIHWFRSGESKAPWLLPLKHIIDKNGKDTLNTLFLKYQFGVYLFYSFNLGANTEIPLFWVPKSNLPCSSKEFYDYYELEHINNFMFLGRPYSLKRSFKIMDDMTETYEIVHEELYQPNFETSPVITGRRVFFISLKEGTIEYRSEGKFQNEWY